MKEEDGEEKEEEKEVERKIEEKKGKVGRGEKKRRRR